MKLKLWGWDKKPRTMLRFIKIGDVFCFEYSDNVYAYGRVIANNSYGHTAEIFDVYTIQPSLLTILESFQFHRLLDPVILDSYSLFDKKREGDWRIIGHQEEFIPTNIENVFYVYGTSNEQKRVDIYGKNPIEVSDGEAKKYMRYSPNGDYDIKKLIEPIVSKMKHSSNNYTSS